MTNELINTLYDMILLFIKTKKLRFEFIRNVNMQIFVKKNTKKSLDKYWSSIKSETISKFV